MVNVNNPSPSINATRAYIGDGVEIGIANNGQVGNILVESKPDITVDANTFGLAGGIGAASVNFAEASIDNHTSATIGNSDIESTGTVTVRALGKGNGKVTGTGVAAGGLAVGVMKARLDRGQSSGQPNTDNEVSAAINNGANITADRLVIRAYSDDLLDVQSVAGAGAAIGGAGAISVLNSNVSSLAFVGTNATVFVDTISITSENQQDLDSKSTAAAIGALSAVAGAEISNSFIGKARVDIAPGSILQASSMSISARNILDKDRFGNGSSDENYNLITVSGSGVVGGSGQASISHIDPTAQVNITGATLRATGAAKEAGDGLSNFSLASLGPGGGLIEITTWVDADTIDRSVATEITGLGGVTVADNQVLLTTRSEVNIAGATLEATEGVVQIATRTDANNSSSTEIDAYSFGSASQKAAGKAETTANQTVNLTGNTRIESSKIRIYAGQDVIKAKNVLYSQSRADAFSASLLPSVSLPPTAVATILERNTINVEDTTRLESYGDIDLIATRGIGDVGDRARAYGEIQVVSAATLGIPVTSDASYVLDDDSFNRVNIENTTKLVAGLGSSAGIHILPVNMGNFPGSIVAGAPLSNAQKAFLSVPLSVDYRFVPLQIGDLPIDFYKDFAARAVTGATAGGTVGRYYRFLPSTSDGSQPVLLHLENFADTSRWEDVGTTPPNETPVPAYDSDVSLRLADAVRDDFVAAQPVEFKPVKLTYRNIGNLLFERREQILQWMSDHATDAAAISRYQVQLDAVETLMEEYGLLGKIPGPNGTEVVTLKKELNTLFVDVPSVISAPGSIFIEAASGTTGTPYTTLVTNNVLDPRAGANINIVNRSPMTMTVNGAKIKDNRRVTTAADGTLLTLEPGNVYVNRSPLTNVTVTADNLININQTREPGSTSLLNDLPIQLADVPQDLYIRRDIINEDGDIVITNNEGSIFANAEIRGENVTINAFGDFNLNTESWIHARDPMQYLNFQTFRDQLFNPHAQFRAQIGDQFYNFPEENRRIVQMDTSFSDGTRTLEQAINSNESRLLAQGRITITAVFLNVNGLIQSGAEQIQFGVSSDFVPPSESTSFLSNDGISLLPGLSFGTSRVPVRGSWDANADGGVGAFILEDITPKGGEISIAGRILSTGNGQIKVANGFPSVTIDNDSPYRVHVGNIDTTKFREGKITIVDNADPDAPTKAEYIYLRNTNQIQQRRFVGTLVNGEDGARIDYGNPISDTTHGMNDNLQYELRAGLQYVWTDGMLATYQTIKTITTDYGFWADVGEFFGIDRAEIERESFTPEFLDERPTVDSETLQLEGTPGSPGYSTGSSYSLLYRRDGDYRTRIDNNTLVRSPGVSYEINFDSPFWTVDKIIDPAAKVYRYVGPLNVDSNTKALIDLTEANFSDTNLWVIDNTQNPQTFEANELDKYEDWFRNQRVDFDRPAPPDDDVTVLKITRTEGLRDLYTHSLKADYPIGISFGNSPAFPSVNIASHGGILLTGGIEVPTGGTVELFSTGGSVLTDGEVVIYGGSPVVLAQGDVQLIIEGDKGPLYVTAGGDIDIQAVSLDNTSSRIVSGLIYSWGGDVSLEAVHGITNDSSLSKVTGNRLELDVKQGGIGSATSPLRIETNVLGTGGLTAYARSNIHLDQVEGDLPLLRSKLVPGAASVESEMGNVTISSAGSILDRDNETSAEDRNRGRRTYNSEFMNDLITAGVSSNLAIAYPVSSVLASALLPNLSLPNLAVPLGERVNVRGTEVMLRAENAGASIGYQAQNIVVTNPRSYNSLSTEEASTFASASPEDVLGVQYGLYRYIGPTRSNVDLKVEDFNNTSYWSKFNATFATGGDASATVQKTVSSGQRVRVEYSQDLYGMYEYLGVTTSINLVGENYLDGVRWRKLAGNVASDGPNVSLNNGLLVTNKDWIDAITFRRTEDVNVVATVGLRATGNQHVLIESPINLPIHRTESGGDTTLRSSGDLIDTNFDEAAVAAGGQVQLIAGAHIASGVSLPFRTQITPTGSLRAESGGLTHVRQLQNDTIINGVAQLINNLFVARVEADGPAIIHVVEGDMLVGYLTSLSSVELQAAGSILDAFPGMNGAYVNVFTPSHAVPGHVTLTAGNTIGSPSSPLTVDIQSGELTSNSSQNTTLFSPTDLTVRSTVSSLGSVSIVGDSDLRVDSIRALSGDVSLVFFGNITDLTGDGAADIEAIFITLISIFGSIGLVGNDLEVNTADSAGGLLSAIAHGDVYVTETSGRLNVLNARSTNRGDVRIVNTETMAAGENIVVSAAGLLSAVDGDLMIFAADDLIIHSQASARNVYLRGDYRNADPEGSVVTINGAVTADYAEIQTDVDDDTVFIAAVVMTGFVVRVAKGENEVSGGSGNDMLYGGPGRDILRGGQGSDWLSSGGGMGNELYGDIGDDRIFGSQEGVDFPHLANGPIQYSDTIYGGQGDDQIWTMGGTNQVFAGDGDDIIYGGSGSDSVLGEDGNDTVYVGGGLGNIVQGGDGNDTIVGSDVGDDWLYGDAGDDHIRGQNGNDELYGGSGDDDLDGGAGVDIIWGGTGNDEIHGGGGHGDTLRGEEGDDLIYGSNDGGDFIYGGLGRDRIYGQKGNDQIEGGSDDDIIDGGDGDDVIYGDAGSDLIIGAAHHDQLYGLNPTRTNPDGGVDYLYGDFATGNNEPNSGNDRLFGDNGRDMLYGEGGDDLIDDDLSIAGVPNPNSSLDFIDYGTGEGPDPTTFTSPSPTPNPQLLPPSPAYQPARAEYPVGLIDSGRWAELASSATVTSSGVGLSRQGIVSPASIASTSSGVVVAWSEAYNGRSRVNVARHDGVAWQELPLPMASGVDGTSMDATNPHLIINAAGNPVVAWTERSALGTDIRIAEYDPAVNDGLGGWIAIGNSLSAGGISGTGNADQAQLRDTPSGLVAVWLNVTASVTQVYARTFVGGVWTSLGTGSDSGTGVSGASSDSDIEGLSVTSNASRLALAWSQFDSISGIRQVYVRAYETGTWFELNGSATGSGASGLVADAVAGVITHNAEPSVAYVGTDLLVAWQTYADQSSHVVVSRYAFATPIPSLVSLTETSARGTQPQLISNGLHANLLWTDGIDHLYAMRWNGTTLIEEVPGDSSGVGITLTGRSIDQFATSIDASGRAAVAWIDLTTGQPSLMVRRNSLPITGTVHIASPAGNSIQQILDTQALGSNDIIVVQEQLTGNVNITAADAGVTIIGAPGARIIGAVTIAADNVRFQRLNVTGSITATNASQFSLRESSVTGGVIFQGGNDSQMSHNHLSSASNTDVVTVNGGASNLVVRSNVLEGGLNGILLGTATGVSILDNQISGSQTGIRIAAAASGEIARNSVDAGITGLDLDALFTGWVRQNKFVSAGVGVRYEFATLLSDNDIRENEIGIIASVNSTSDGLGFQTGTLPNRIDNNVLGVQLTGRMQNQRITNNGTGVVGSGELVGNSLDTANVIEDNETGVNFNGRVEFQRIGRNTTGIVAYNSQTIAHNVLYRNATSVQIVGRSDVRVVGNTLYTPLGDHLRVIGGSQNVELQNNIFWTEDGYNIFVSNDSTVGFFSDFNVLHTSGAGKIGFWTKDFNDILDWQEDIYRFDLNSIGRTVVNPTWSEPRFTNKAQDDYRILGQVARQRFTSPTIDAGNPLMDIARPTSTVNLINNPSFESGLNSWTATPSGSIRTVNPAPFDGTNYFGGDANVTSTLTQVISLTDAGYTPTQLDNEDLTILFGGRVRSANEILRDGGTIRLTLLDVGGATIGDPLLAVSTRQIDRWELIGGRHFLPSGVRSVRYEFLATRNTGISNDSYLDGAFLLLQPSRTAADAGAYSQSNFDVAQPAHLVLRSPDLYKDWERDKPLDIRWDSYGNATNSPVIIDLYQDTASGPTFVTRITSAAPDIGKFTWIAANSGVDYGTTSLRIQITLADNSTIFDRSTETFTLPESTNTFFVNDASLTNDEFTTTAGNNRNTGKVAGAPKPYPNNLLRIYTLGANQSLTIDQGSYLLLSPLVIGNAQDVGDDEGFTLRGAAVGTSNLTHANSFTIAPVVELSDADLMNIQDVSISGGRIGIHVRNFSTDLNMDRVRLSSNTAEGLLIEAGSTANVLEQLQVSSNAGNGIRILGTLNTLRDSTISGNLATGLVLQNTGGSLITGNNISGNVGVNSNGVELLGTPASPLFFGSDDLALGLGNRVFNNGRNGILVNGNAIVAGNIVYGHTTNNASGIVGSIGSILKNVVHSNTIGVTNNLGQVLENRIYNSSDTGIVQNGGHSYRNVVYSNAIGARVKAGEFRNNLVYDNTTRGVSIDGSSQFINNTVHQQAGEAVRVQSNGAQLRNNIFWVDGNLGNVALVVAQSGQSGFLSDFNAFYLSNSAGAGQWEGVRYASLVGFQTASQSNANSLQGVPNFVSVAGTEGLFGYVNASQDGRDDDFHLQSTFGSFHGGSFAPVATGNGTGIPVALIGNWVNDAVQSVAIDAGNPADSFANETLDNGNVINMGVYGNTAHASRSPASYLTVKNPDGGEIWVANQTFNIRWTTHNLNAAGITYSIDLLKVGVPVLNIAAAAPGTGVLPWTVPNNLVPANDFTIQVTANGAGGLVDVSNAPFTIAQQVTVYYVNDGTVEAGDWTTVAGNDANDGLSPVTPKATLQSLLATYDFGPGDRIRIDAGNYVLASDIVIAAGDAGVTLEGYNNAAIPGRRSVINRNAARPAFELQNADNITFEYLEITGASTGILAATNSDSDDLIVRNSRFISVGTAVLMDTTSDRVQVANSYFDGVAGYGQRHVILNGQDSLVEDNYFTRGGTGGNSSSGSIMVTGVRSIVQDNEVVDDRAVSGSIFISTGFSTESDRVIIRSNTIRDTQSSGLFGGSGTLIENNTLTNINSLGAVNPTLAINSTGIVRGNTISNSQWALNGAGLFENNRIYNNERGITSTSGGRYIGNQIYDNLVAVQVGGSNPLFRNNDIYRNDVGFILGSQGFGSSAILENNTIYQPTGNAIVWVNLNSSATMRNNIFWVSSGRAFEAPDGGLIPSSDYNQFYLTSTGSLANYGGQTYSDSESWFFALGYDKNSRMGDPLFVDIDGADNILGFDRGNGLLGSYFNNPDLSGAPLLQRTERIDLTSFGSPGPGVNADNFSARWEGFIHIPTAGDYTFYAQNDDGVRLFFDNTLRIDQWVSNSTEYSYTATGLAAGWYPIQYEMRELTGFAQAKLSWQGPGFAKQVVLRNSLGTNSGFTNTDEGLDDSFVVGSASTTIDAGDYSSAYHLEPMPNGDRINIGSTGNTPDAASQIGPQIYVVDPNGLEKIATSSITTLRWQSSGLTINRPVMLVNLGSSSRVDTFQADDVRVEGQVQVNGAIDTSGVASPAPAAVYSSAVRTTGGIGTKAAFQLPVPDGNYNLRLHFASVFGAGVTLNVVVNGVTIATNYDPFVAAGGINRAAVLPVDVSAIGGMGLRLEIVANAAFGALIHGLELTTSNTVGVADPRIDLQWSGDGTVWNTIATNQPMDRFGRGQFNWSVPANLPLGNNYRIQAISSPTTPSAMDQSDKPFEIVGSGTSYYVNDNSLTNDVYSTEVGNDSNSGKSPSQPMNSLETLLRSYDLNPGDTIYVDSGIHTLTRDITIANEDSGVRIVGPADRSAIFQRTGTASSNNAIFRLNNADGITFENVELQGGGGYGIYSPFANGNAGSDGLTIRNSRFTNLTNTGVFLDQGNNFATVDGSVFDGGIGRNMGIHVYLLGTNSIVTNSMFTKYFGSGSHTYSVYVHGSNSLVDGNQFIDNNSGNLSVRGGSTPEAASTASNNIVQDSVGNGIEAGASVVVENNQVYNMGSFGNVSQPYSGIRGSGSFRNNLIHNTQVGMLISSGTATGNTVYNTVQAGVWTGGTVTLVNNRIYSNPLGVLVYNVLGGGSSNNNPLLINNLIYSNGTGIQLNGSSSRLTNNTIYQSVGDAVISTQGNESVSLENNIFSVDAGSVFSLPTGISSISGNYNLYHVRGTGRIASQLGVNFTDLATWSFAQNMDADSLAGDPQFVDVDGPDNVLGYASANFGADDNFRVLGISPSIDRGNPYSFAANEPTPNGSRINIGSFGNTFDATLSASEVVQVLSPNGYEKLESGQPVVVRFQSSGLVPERSVAQIAAGNATSEYWNSGIAYRTGGFASTTASAIDVSGVTNPPPQSLYQDYVLSNGISESLQYAVPMANGAYNIRLHFFEPNTSVGVGGRRFDVQLQGATVDPNVDVRALAGAANKAITRIYSGVNVTGGLLNLRLVNLTGNGAVLVAIEINADEAVVDSTPTVTLQYSSNSGTSWSTVATNVQLDNFGRGQFVWTPTTPTNTRSSLYRVVSEQGLLTSDTSDHAFEVVSSGTEYYVSATGDNTFGGKTPDRPMRTLSAVIESYDLDLGDRINVASGIYLLSREVVITSQDSGVTIQGPADTTAIFNRQNQSSVSNEFAFNLVNADDITLDSIQVTSADIGVYAANSSDSDGLIVNNSRVFGNQSAGILLGSTNDRFAALNNAIYGLPGGSVLDDQAIGISLRDTIDNAGGHDQIIDGNDIFDNGIGINMTGLRSIARNNTVHGNSTGIRAFSPASSIVDGMRIENNSIFANTLQGVFSGGNTTIVDNEVYGHSSATYAVFASSAVVANNTIRNNNYGLDASTSTVIDNRIYGQSNVGLNLQGNSQATGNRVYSNSTGIRSASFNTVSLANNTIYANVNRGLLIENGGSSSIVNVFNNTIYHAVGDAVRLQNSARNVRLANNIITIASGFAINVDNNSQVGFESNYNLLYRSIDPSARIGFWNANQISLLDWQVGSGRDSTSVSSDPLFIDIDGADGVLGFTIANGDGGADDNFQRLQNSPATDRGDSWNAWPTDIDGFTASDDPAVVNAGRPTLVPTVLGSSQFTATGVAQPSWRGYGAVSSYTLPFSFNFFGVNYNTVFVSSSGLLQFGNGNNAGDNNNSTTGLISAPRIAALWDNIRTDINTAPADNMFVDTSVAGQVKFRWDGTNFANNTPVNFAIVLFNDGRIRFDYGAGNMGLSPTVGISSGNGTAFTTIPGYDGALSLTNANSIEFNFASGFRDIGAYEFRGNSSDTTPPTITGTTPAVIGASGITAESITQIVLQSSEPINAIDAVSPLYELRSSGPDNEFGNSDDVLFSIARSYDAQTSRTSLSLLDAGMGLPAGRYRLTVTSNANAGLRDESGNLLDGDGNGTPGGNYVRIFRVTANIAPSLTGSYNFPSLAEDVPNSLNPGTLVANMLLGRVTDADGPGQGIAITNVDNTDGTWEFTLDGVAYSAIVPQLVGDRILLLGSDSATGVRFRPNANFNGPAGGITYRAWDRTDQNVNGASVMPGEIFTNSLSSQVSVSSIFIFSVNDPPTGLLLDQASVNENTSSSNDVFFGTLTAVDSDVDDFFAFDFVDGQNSQDNDRFVIRNGNQLFLRAGEVLDYEAIPNYSVRVRVTDSSGATFAHAWSIGVNDLIEVDNIRIDSGSDQRSVIRSLTVTFDGSVSIAEGAFELRKQGVGGGLVQVSFTSTTVGGMTQATLQLSGAFTEYGSLADGHYDLRIVASMLTSPRGAFDGNSDGQTGDDFTFGQQATDNFFRLFGDSNSDRFVGLADFNVFRAAFGKSDNSPGFNRAFDFNDDDVIGLQDFNEFRRRFGISI